MEYVKAQIFLEMEINKYCPIYLKYITKNKSYFKLIF